MRDLRNKVVVITGAAGGIGEALARGLSAKGAHLALVDVDASRLAAVATELKNADQRVTQHQVDVGNREQMRELPEAVVAAHGCVDVLINNAGVSVEPCLQTIPSRMRSGCYRST